MSDPDPEDQAAPMGDKPKQPAWRRIMLGDSERLAAQHEQGEARRAAQIARQRGTDTEADVLRDIRLDMAKTRERVGFVLVVLLVIVALLAYIALGGVDVTIVAVDVPGGF